MLAPRLAASALTVDVVWLAMQIQSWWLPYILGTEGWQLAYTKGSTTKVLVLPSFGHYVISDGMHFLIHVLLVGALGDRPPVCGNSRV